MNLTGFVDIDFKNEGEYREFLDLNALAHQTVHNTLLQVFQITVEQYPLFTMAGIDKDWLMVHAAEHTAWANALGLNIPPDLDAVDFDNKQEMEDWLNNHALAHTQVSIAIGT